MLTLAAAETASVWSESGVVIAVIGVVGGILGSFLTYLYARKKNRADTSGVLVDTASEVVSLVRTQMAEVVAQNHQLQTEVHALRQEIAELRERVGHVEDLEEENRILRSEVARLSLRPVRSAENG